MNEHFNKLTPAEDERLSYLAEECSEVIKACMKIQRHGYEIYNPDSIIHESNREILERELGDVILALNLMYENKDISEKMIMKKAGHKSPCKYFHHQESFPTIEDLS